jgi:hypothetical protein
MQHATYHWKPVDEGYNFASNLITIESLHRKLCAFKVTRIPADGISGQKAIWMWPPWRAAEYMGEGGGFPRVWAVVNLMSFESPVARLNTKCALENELTNLLVG